MKTYLLPLLPLLLLPFLFFGQSPVRITDGNANQVIFGAVGTKGVRFDSGLTAIATSSGTILTSTTTAVQAIHCNTINSTASTVTIKNGSGTVYWDAVALTANTVTFEQFGPVGMSFSGGVTIVAGTTSALVCQVVGVQ